MGGHLTEEEIQFIIKMCGKHPHTFVETGTYKGQSTRSASSLFERVITFEIHKSLYEESRKNNANISNITYYLGDTVQLLPKVIPSLQGSSCMWFLDAHQSGCDTSNNGTWVPLLDELTIILPQITSEDVIIIDDVRLFSTAWDWKAISIQSVQELCTSLHHPVYKKYIHNDRLILTFK